MNKKLDECVQSAYEILNKNDNIMLELDKNGLSRDVIDEHKIGILIKDNSEGEDECQLVIPNVNLDGTCSGVSIDTISNLFFQASNDMLQTGNGVFNGRRIQEGEEAAAVIFITNSVYDALSIEEAGAYAVADTSTKFKQILREINKNKPKSKFALALDDSDDVRYLMRMLNKMGYLVQDVTSAISGTDPMCVSYLKDSDGFKNRVHAAVNDVRDLDPAKAYLNTSTGSTLQYFIDDIENKAYGTPIPTGYEELDKIMNGGFMRGVTIVGGISGIGKTTFILQAADNAAELGFDVLVFSLEMDQREMIAKSISRLSYQVCRKKFKNKMDHYASSTTDILLNRLTCDAQREMVVHALNEYEHYANGHIWIIEPEYDITVENIINRVEYHHQMTGHYPLVVIDYLQIIASHNDSRTDKQNMDHVIKRLRALGKKTPVVGISSYNRESYEKPVSLGAFKESGSLEYTCSVAIGMQYTGMDEPWNYMPEEECKALPSFANAVTKIVKNNEARARAGYPMDIQVKVLKNRFGYRDSAYFDFYPKFNFYADAKGFDAEIEINNAEHAERAELSKAFGTGGGSDA